MIAGSLVVDGDRVLIASLANCEPLLFDLRI